MVKVYNIYILKYIFFWEFNHFFIYCFSFPLVLCITHIDNSYSWIFIYILYYNRFIPHVEKIGIKIKSIIIRILPFLKHCLESNQISPEPVLEENNNNIGATTTKTTAKVYKESRSVKFIREFSEGQLGGHTVNIKKVDILKKASSANIKSFAVASLLDKDVKLISDLVYDEGGLVIIKNVGNDIKIIKGLVPISCETSIGASNRTSTSPVKIKSEGISGVNNENLIKSSTSTDGKLKEENSIKIITYNLVNNNIQVDKKDIPIGERKGVVIEVEKILTAHGIKILDHTNRGLISGVSELGKESPIIIFNIIV